MKSVVRILQEQIMNRYRAFSIAKYELLSEMRESRLGVFWNIANPCIQLFTYWFVFGIGLRNGRAVGHVPFISWMVVGMSAWFLISPSILKGTSCIYSKKRIVSKIKFPKSILPVIVVLKELFNHLCMLLVVLGVYVFNGGEILPSWGWLLYYIFCNFSFCVSISMVLSVLNMFTRDVKKLVSALMRMLMYLTPILWTMENFAGNKIIYLLKANPLYYIVEGYRGAVFFNEGPLSHPAQTLFFWGIVVVLYTLGSYLMDKYQDKFIDMY